MTVRAPLLLVAALVAGAAGAAPPPATSVAPDDTVVVFQSGRAVTATAGQITALGAGPTALNITVTTRDVLGRVTAYASSGTAYAVTYDAFGPATIVGGGKTITVTRDATGNVTSIATS